jgi:hypothetical protein
MNGIGGLDHQRLVGLPVKNPVHITCLVGEVVTGLLYISPDSKDVHDQNDTVPGSLYNLPHAQLCPGNEALQKLMGQFR